MKPPSQSVEVMRECGFLVAGLNVGIAICTGYVLPLGLAAGALTVMPYPRASIGCANVTVTGEGKPPKSVHVELLAAAEDCDDEPVSAGFLHGLLAGGIVGGVAGVLCTLWLAVLR